MPIYAYRCEACGFAKDVLQKVSDAVLTECPSCSQSAFRKQVTAAGFQLKGTGWYVTDFRNNGGTKSGATGAGTPAALNKSTSDSATGSVDSSSGSSGAASTTPASCD